MVSELPCLCFPSGAMAVAGYTGFRPGVLNGDSEVFASSPLTTPTTSRAKSAIPGYRGHIGGKTLYHGATYSAHNRQAIDRKNHAECETRPGGAVPGSPKRAGFPSQGRAGIAIAGYSGHCPQQKEMIGGNFIRTQKLAAKELKNPGHFDWRRPSGPGHITRKGTELSPGHTIPGYAGHVPFKPDVVGQGAARGGNLEKFKEMKAAKSPARIPELMKAASEAARNARSPEPTKAKARLVTTARSLSSNATSTTAGGRSQ